MSDESSNPATGNTTATTQNAGGEGQIGGVPIQIVTQFIKDLSFENPNMVQQLAQLQQAQQSAQQLEQPRLNFNLTANVQQVGQETYEVTLATKLDGKRGEETAFIMELSYAGIFAVKSDDRDTLMEILYVECPRLLFPFARSIIADVTRDGGLQPIVLNPIDFAELYRKQRAEQDQATGGAGAAAPAQGSA